MSWPIVLVACWVSFMLGFLTAALFAANGRDLDE